MRHSRLATAIAAGLAAAGTTLFMAGAALGAPLKPGIDVSVWQGRIDWKDVARSGERFAFIKATEGRTYVDPWYLRNKRRASWRGLKVGAYHYARPERGSKEFRASDARREARHFVESSGLRPGYLRPVIDLEESGGVPCRPLKRWVRLWLEVVREELGVKGMIYTSPNFWRTHMCNTRWFAEHGYRALWIAHWDTRRPEVPAGNWDGQGWTFWQYTSCGRVPGVSGCVDRDRYRYERWRPVLIPRRGDPPSEETLPGVPDLPELP